MELLYIVELDVRSSESGELSSSAVRARVLEHTAAWLNFEHSPELSVEAFSSPGDAILVSSREGRSDARISWITEGTEDVHALVATVRTEINKSGRADFICVVTVFVSGQRVAVRLELARESLDGVLAPAGTDFFRRPSLVMMLSRDRELECWAGPSRVDGRFNWVNPRHADFVWNALSTDGRLLPVLLVDGSDGAGEELAKRAATELAGLAPVLAVDARSQELLSERLNDIDAAIPRGGARLVWPDTSLRHPNFTADQAPLTPGRLLRMLSAVSVTVRGTNHLLREASAAQRVAVNKQMADELAAARARGDLSQEVEAQARVIQQLTSDVEQYDSWFKQVEGERDSYKAKAAQAAYWKQEAERARQAGHVRITDWGEAPILEKSDLSALSSFLEKQSQGAILFTRDAHQSWRRDAYPRIEVMRDSLITLTQAAIEYRRLGCQLGMFPDDWFKLEWELTLAATDKYMSQNGLGDFQFEGKSYSRLPHIKLGDHTSPNEVGRIYFAMDADDERFIVDHVGLKLYGL